MSNLEIYLYSLLICTIFGSILVYKKVKNYNKLTEVEQKEYVFFDLTGYAFFSLIPIGNSLLAILSVLGFLLYYFLHLFDYGIKNLANKCKGGKV